MLNRPRVSCADRLKGRTNQTAMCQCVIGTTMRAGRALHQIELTLHMPCEESALTQGIDLSVLKCREMCLTSTGRPLKTHQPAVILAMGDLTRKSLPPCIFKTCLGRRPRVCQVVDRQADEVALVDKPWSRESARGRIATGQGSCGPYSGNGERHGRP